MLHDFSFYQQSAAGDGEGARPPGERDEDPAGAEDERRGQAEGFKGQRGQADGPESGRLAGSLQC